MTGPEPASAVPLYLPADGWEQVLDALDVAADWTADDIDCETCANSTFCDMHEGDWARVEHWRGLAAHLRGQLIVDSP